MKELAKNDDENDGFEILLDEEKRVVYIKKFGFWTDDHTDGYLKALKKAIDTQSKAINEKVKGILLDIDAFKAGVTELATQRAVTPQKMNDIVFRRIKIHTEEDEKEGNG